MSPTSVLDDDVAIFKEWLAKKPFLPMTDDNIIRTFLVHAKGSIQKAKVKYDFYFKTQQTLKEIFDDFDPMSKKMQNTYRHLALCNIPGEKYTVIVSKLLSDDPTHVSLNQFCLLQLNNVQLQLWDDTLGNCQIVHIMDFAKCGFGHLKGFNPVTAEKYSKALLGAPHRFKATHLLNVPTAIEWALTIVMQFVPEKLKSRWFIHSSVATLSDHVDMKYVPEDYGGLNRTVAYHQDQHLARLKFYREKFQKQKALREAEAKMRPVDKDQDTTATFRKLAID